MSVALYIVLCSEGELDFESFVNGKTLGRHGDCLEGIAKSLGLRPLMEFFSIDPGELEGMLDPDVAAGDLPPPPAEEWFDARDGLTTVTGLIAHLKGEGRDTPHASGLLSDLHEFKSLLSEAAKAGLQWHLSVDA